MNDENDIDKDRISLNPFGKKMNGEVDVDKNRI